MLAYHRLSIAAREFRPDFIYERYNLFLLAGALLRRKLGIPLLLEVNAPLAEERGRFGGLGLPRLARWAESRAWRDADFVLPVTQVLAGHVAAVGVPTERIVVIPNGINRAHFAAAPTPEIAKRNLGLSGALVLGFTGFVRDWHGVDRVIRWMATSDAPVNAMLMVVGDGPVRIDLERLAAKLSLQGRVRFTGVIDRDRVPEHVAAFDIALQPAVVSYASPLKLFEYLALGKPVIAPRQPNIEEILTDGDNALLFDANEPGAFERMLTRLCADAALRDRLAAAAAATIDRLDLTWLGNAQAGNGSGRTVMIRTLLFSTLYPNSVRPSHGIFVETRLRHLLASGEVETRVVAPVPWFPFRHKIFGEYAKHSVVPRHETRNGISIEHPRYLLLPKIGMNSAPYALARTGLAAARRLIAAGYDFDLIDAHYFYPDGVAATMIGKALNKPVVITARGTDINLIPQYPKPKQMILDAARDCAAMITVCAALKDAIVGLGGSAEKITVLRNGVDLELFRPEDRQQAKAAFGMNAAFAIASVGHLIERKGHHLVIEAMPQLPDAELYIAGAGEEDSNLRALANRLGVSDRVHFLGAMPQDKLRTLYNAADCLVLASSREGWANVLLEAMACGTPVVASNVWGTPEVVATPEAGVLMDRRSAVGVFHAIKQLRQALPDRNTTRLYAKQFSWDATTRGQLELFSRLCNFSYKPLAKLHA